MDYPEAGESNEIANDKQKILIFAGIGIFFFVLILFAIVSQFASNRGQQTAQNSSPTPPIQTSGNKPLFNDPTEGPVKKATPPVAGAAAKIGAEIIYNVDVTRETSALPNSDDSSVIEQVFNKMVNDSVTLQQAAKEGYIKLDTTVFNSRTKDYTKRIELIEEAKRSVEMNADGYSGSFVAIWFHNQKPGRVGYAQGKQLAYNKIKPLYDQVKAGQMTMLEASDAIIADASLEDVDEAFRVNSYGDFKVTAETQATFDPAFNAKLAKLRPGQITDLHLAKDKDERGNMIDAVYMFGKVDSVTANKGYTNYEEWLDLHRSKYEIIQY